jgi:YD repeat-containing protein
VHATTGTGTDHTATYAYPTPGSSQPHTVTTVAGAGAPGAGSYGYDQAGNTTTTPGQTLTYDEQGRLSTDTTSGGMQRNIYDASGNLLLQTDPGQGASLFLGDTVLHQAGSDPVSAVRTYTAAGTPVAERTGTTGSSTVPLTWLFTDVDGNVDVQTDSTSGATSDSFRDPFGNPTSTGTGVWADGNGFLNHPATTSIGLTSLGAMFYNPAIGRFEGAVDRLRSPVCGCRAAPTGTGTTSRAGRTTSPRRGSAPTRGARAPGLTPRSAGQRFSSSANMTRIPLGPRR